MELVEQYVNWNKVPQKYKWAAIDADGEIFLYERKPFPVGNMWYSEDNQLYLRINPTRYWREEICQRPPTSLILADVTNSTLIGM